MAFVPPFFNKFGQASKDLLSGISFSNGVTFKNVSADGVAVEASLSQASAVKACCDEKLNGNLRVASVGVVKNVNIESEINTQCNGYAKVVSTDLFGLCPQAEVTSAVGSTPFNSEANTGGCYFDDEVKFRRDNVAVTLGTNTGFQRKYATVGRASVAAGYDGFTAGLGATFPVYNSEGTPVTVDGGLEYKHKDVVAGLFTTNNHAMLNFHTFWAADLRTTVAGALEYDLLNKDAQNVMTLGSSYRVDRDCNLSFKANNLGAVTIKLQHRLARPAAEVSFAAEFDARTKSLHTNKFGFQATFGDY